MTSKTAYFITHQIETNAVMPTEPFYVLWREFPKNNKKYSDTRGEFRRAILAEELERLPQAMGQQIINWLLEENYKKVTTFFRVKLII